MTLAEVRAVVPKVLYQKHTLTGLAYVARDVLCAVALYNFGWSIDPLARSLVEDYGWSLFFGVASKWFSWVIYWYWQGIILAGWWCLAHEAGHGTLSQYNSVNHIVGYSLHTVSALISSAPQCSNHQSFFLFLTTHGDPLITLITKPPCPWNATKTMSLARVEITVFLRNPPRPQQTITKYSKKLRYTRSSVCSLCRL